MALKCGFEQRQMLVGLEAPEALLRFQHARGSPAQSHLCIPPALHIPAYLANDAVHALDDVGAGQRAAQVRRQTEPVDGQDLVQTLENGFGDSRGLMFKPLGEVADQTLGFHGIVLFPGLTKSPANTGMKLRRKPVQDIPGLVDLTALNGDVGAEGAADGLAQRLGAIHHEEPADIGVEVAVNEVVEKRLDHLGVFGRALHHTQWMLLAVDVDAHRARIAREIAARPSAVLGPVDSPPWNRHRPLRKSCLHWHAVPRRVRAPQTGFGLWTVNKSANSIKDV